MRNVFVLSALASAALLSSAAIASQTAPAAPQTEENGSAPAAKPKKEKKICRSVSNSSSRLRKSICKTQAEWDNGAGQSDDPSTRSHVSQ